MRFSVRCLTLSVILLACWVSIAAAQPLHAAPPAVPQPAIALDDIVVTTSGCVARVTGGWEFLARADVTVRALGVWDQGEDGLAEAHPVALWNQPGELLVSAMVPARAGGKLIDGFRYVPIRPVVLQAGRTYVVGAFYSAPLQDPHVGGGSNNRISTDPRIAWTRARRVVGDELMLPLAPPQRTSDAGIFGPNLLIASKPPVGRVVRPAATAPKAHDPQPAAGEVVLAFEGRIDGSQKIEISQTHAYWQHVHWRRPGEPVKLGGIAWDPKKQSALANAGPTRFLRGPVDFSTARLRNVHGRDTVVLQPRKDSVVVHLVDTPNGGAPYRFDIVMKRPTVPATLRIVADIDGSDRLHIDTAGARWQHRHWSMPKKVSLGGIDWDPSTSPRIENAGSTRFLPTPVDFASAKLTVREARDLVVLEHVDEGIVVHFADNPLGRATYDLTISFGP